MIADRGFLRRALAYSGDSEMKKLANETGGRVIDVGNKMDKLKEAFDQIAKELRSQYNIGYTPANTKSGRRLSSKSSCAPNRATKSRRAAATGAVGPRTETNAEAIGPIETEGLASVLEPVEENLQSRPCPAA